jgi:hypothetical protein
MHGKGKYLPAYAEFNAEKTKKKKENKYIKVATKRPNFDVDFYYYLSGA